MDFEKLASAVQTIDGTVKNIVALNTSVRDTADIIEELPPEPSRTVKDFLDFPIGDKKDLIMRKAMAAAMVIAQDKDLIAVPVSDASELASAVDDGLTRVKTAYQVGVGTLEPEEAIDAIIDAAEARVVAVVDRLFDKAVNTATEVVVKVAYKIPLLGKIIGPAAETMKPIISSVITRVAEPARNAVKAGIHFIASSAKSVARKAVSVIKAPGRMVAKAFKSFR